MQRARAFFRSLFGLKQESVAKPAAIEKRTFRNEFAIPGKRIIITGGYRVELDLTGQVLAVKTPIDRDFNFDYQRGLQTRARRSATEGNSRLDRQACVCIGICPRPRGENLRRWIERMESAWPTLI
jgi:hypothetical protein